MDVNWEEIENEYTDVPEGHVIQSSQLPDNMSEKQITQAPDSLSPNLTSNLLIDAVDHDEVNRMYKDQLKKPDVL